MANRMSIDKRSGKDFLDTQHERAVSNYLPWMLTAEQLLRAYRILANQAELDIKELFDRDVFEHSVSGQSIMLGALAIENLLKAIRIKQIGCARDERGAFTLKTHDLIELAEDAGLVLSADEERLLERLEQYQLWAGRYPTFLYSEALRPRTLPNGGFVPRTVQHIPNDFDAISDFVIKLKKELPDSTSGDGL